MRMIAPGLGPAVVGVWYPVNTYGSVVAGFRLRASDVGARLEPNIDVAPRPLTAVGPSAPIWNCVMVWPARNTALPVAETAVNTGWALAAISTSPMRPPQPERAPSGDRLCQVDAWSLCEKSLRGSAVPAR